jgi:hypothetical protein
MIRDRDRRRPSSFHVQGAQLGQFASFSPVLLDQQRRRPPNVPLAHDRPQCAGWLAGISGDQNKPAPLVPIQPPKPPI